MIRIAATKPVRLFFAGALALSMSSAAAITASANQAYAETDDGYTYCYAGLSWAEYWAGEDVYEAGNDASSDKVDSKGDHDCGAYDAVSRSTWRHGPQRGSYQCAEILEMTDGTKIYLDYFEAGTSGSTFYDTNGIKYTKNSQIITKYASDGETVEATYTYSGHTTIGTKYVPVKIATSDLDDFKADRKAKGFQVIENGGTLHGGTDSEGVVKNYTAIADVDSNTYGLKTVTKSNDSFEFSAANVSDEQTDSGIKDQDPLKQVTTTTYDGYLSQLKNKFDGTTTDDPSGVYVAVAGSDKGISTPSIKTDKKTGETSVSEGSKIYANAYGDFIRVDLCGDYGSLGAAMQSVTWTYYGDDSSGKNVVRKFGTKFAADNWMHSANDIQLGLTDSIRCQFPKGYDGTGYWTITLHALGYEDYTTSLFEITEDSISKDALPVSSETKANLEKLVAQAKSLKQSEYTNASWSAFLTELDEADELLAKANLFEAEAGEQIQHVTEAINSLVKVIAKPTASSTKFTYNGKQQSPFKDGTGYTVSGKQTNAGSYTAKVTLAKGYAWNAEGDTSTVSQSYTIAKANQSLTAKASTKTVKKAKVKKKAQKVSGAVKVTGAQGKATYAKKSGSAKLEVASNGKITVKKKTKKGTYKVKVVVKAAGNGNYNAATKTVTVKVKVK